MVWWIGEGGVSFRIDNAAQLRLVDTLDMKLRREAFVRNKNRKLLFQRNTKLIVYERRIGHGVIRPL